MAVDSGRPSSAFPEGEGYVKHLRRRQRVGRFWLSIFFLATMVGIASLVALGYDIADDAFGYVAIRNNIDPEVLTVQYYKDKMLAMPTTLASEDDELLVKGIAARPNAIGFFGYSYFKNNGDALRALPIDGVEAGDASVEAGDYPLARPLYLYTTDVLLKEKPQVAAFTRYYLENAGTAASQAGYFAAPAADLEQGLATWSEATGLTATTAGNLLPAGGDILVVGSSTVAPLTQQIADSFAATGQFDGAIQVESIGTDAGFREFCQNLRGDLVGASRPMVALDRSACLQKGRTPIEFQVANDGIPIVVSSQNEFLTVVTQEQLQAIFTGAEKWSDVDASWPEQPIFRFIPGADSGTLDFFVAETFGSDLESQPVGVLADMLAANISAGRLRALEAEKPLAARTQEELRQLLQDEVVKPQIVATWSLVESLTQRTAIEAEVAAMPGAELVFRSWVNWQFVTSPQSTDPLKAGVQVAILGSLWVVLIAFLVSVPLGVGAAIYLEEYSTGKSRFDQIVETNINNLAGVPSIIYGMLGLAVFVRFLGPITSGLAFGVGDPATANGRTILSAGLTLGLLILPLVIINAREAIRAVPRSLREASYGLGATRWQTIWNHVLPNAIPGILTGVILSVSRAFGETAPLIVVGVSTFIVVSPDSVFAKYTTLPAQIYQWTSRPQPEFQHLAAAAIIVLLFLLIAMNATAIWLRNRFARRRIL
ncbi:MAG: phosphate ABC transporter permease PstA [Caldilinea sp.]|nr:phosphate ABC transporter permease PstA [Caldilinea sp.]MCB0146046.1 phosphate ABC transporter permease PstA [Caldilineaceae bacterium]MCW5842037.1 phosphate ABC transporter permease PstA [Caldilinea sp.]